MPARVLLAASVILATAAVRAPPGDGFVPEVDGLRKYLFVSAPKLSQVVYLKLTPPGESAMPLISRQLKAPFGVAADAKRMMLFVADPGEKQIFWYGIAVNPTGSLSVTTKQKIAAAQVTARWVSIDGYGNIFFTDEENNKIMRVSAENFRAGDTKPETVYDGKEVAAVSQPSGIAVDNFDLYWANKEEKEDGNIGSVIQGFEKPPQYGVSTSLTSLVGWQANDPNKVYGVCLQLENLFYTADGSVWGVKKHGGPTALISDRLLEPRGVASDGEGTVYVADKKGNGIYRFSANMHLIVPQPMDHVLKFQGPYGLAFFGVESGTMRSGLVRLLAPAAALAAALALSQ